MAPRFIAKQLSNPTGFFGAVIRALMNRTNASLNAFALKMLEAGPADRVLEIGFGGGLTLPALIANAASVTGLDRSPDVIEQAKTRYRRAAQSGRASFHLGTVENLPFDNGSFSKVLTVNTVYFWKSLDEGFAQVYRVLSPDGRAIIGFMPKDYMDRMNMPADIFTPRTPQDVLDALTRAGFRNARIERPQPSTTWAVAVAEKP